MTDSSNPQGGNKTSITGNVTGSTIVTGDGTTIQQAPIPTIQSLHQIPAPPQDFTGREKELTALCQAVQNEGVVLSGVRGMGGVGKTALALVLAQRLAPDYPDAQLFVNMFGSKDTATPPTTPAAAMQQIIQAWHPTTQLPEDENQLAALYHSVLHGKKALILLDDARDRAQVEPLLPPATCLLLVTTRQRFTLPGLKELDLDTLSEAEAIQLINKITPRAGEKTSEIAKACGHLPLALRLAASALREQANLSAEALLARLTNAEKRFTTLKAVQAAIQVSYDLLTKDLQAALRQLAVFPADFDQPAAAAVWNLDEDADAAQENLAALMRASLLDYNAKTGRYTLHDLVRAAAENLLEREEKEQTAYNHAAHYLEVLDKANDLYLEGGEKILVGLSLFDREWENIKAGQAWTTRPQKDKRAIKLCVGYANTGTYCRYLRLAPHKQIGWLKEALSAIHKTDNRKGLSIILGNLGLAYNSLGEYQQAIIYYQQTLEIARENRNRYIESNALGSLGSAHRYLGQTRTAINYYQQALEIADKTNDQRGKSNSLGNLGNAYFDLGKLQRAIDYYQQHLDLNRKIGDQHSESVTLCNLGSAYLNLGQIQKAINHYQQALVIDRQIGDRRGEGADLCNLGNAYAARGQVKKAINYYQQGIKIAREIGDRLGEATANWNLGRLLVKQGQLQEAVDLIQVNVNFLVEISHPKAKERIAYLEKLKNNL